MITPTLTTQIQRDSESRRKNCIEMHGPAAGRWRVVISCRLISKHISVPQVLTQYRFPDPCQKDGHRFNVLDVCGSLYIKASGEDGRDVR